jgi:ankyrin repeat protein
MSRLRPRDMMPPNSPVDEALFTALRDKDYDALRAHLAAGNPADQIDAENNTPLFLALKAKDPAAVRILLEAGADVDESSPYSSDSALRLALQSQCKECVKLLLDHGADPGFYSVGDGPDGKKSREKPVTDLEVSKEGDPEIAAMVEEAFQKFRMVHAVSGRTIGANMHYRCDRDVVRQLVKEGVPVDIKDGNERTALMYAVIDRDIPMVQMLLEEFKANPEVTMKDGEYTALCFAVSGRDTDPALVNLLVAHGADPKRVFGNGKTMMHIAATSNNPEIMKMLAAMGVPLNTVSKAGQTPVAAGIEYGHENLAPVMDGVIEWWKEQVADFSQRATRLENDVKPMRPLSLRSTPKA